MKLTKKSFCEESSLVQYQIHLSQEKESTKPLIFAVDFEDLLQEGNELLNNLLINGFNVAIIKPIGFDITKTSPITQRHIYNDDYKITYHAFINGKSILGIRVQNCLNMISSHEVDSLATNGIIFFGSGQGGLIGTLFISSLQ